VDNGSVDGTAAAIATGFPDVKLICSSTNLGAVARNHAVAQVGTPYVAFCDDDIRWQPGALTTAADILDRHSALASVTGHCLVEPDLRDDPITPELRDSPVRRPPWLPGPALGSILAGLSMLRVEAFRAAGGFSPRLWLGGEEELLSVDLAVNGWWLCWADDVVIHHAPSTARDPRRRRQLGIRNTLWTAWLRRPARSAWRHTFAVLRGAPRDWATVAAVLECIAGMPSVLRSRRVVPPEVERQLRLLDGPRRRSTARRYVG
jgi:GT2 family glycosyltransferase